jgi:hypothetical protein
MELQALLDSRSFFAAATAESGIGPPDSVSPIHRGGSIFHPPRSSPAALSL